MMNSLASLALRRRTPALSNIPATAIVALLAVACQPLSATAVQPAAQPHVLQHSSSLLSSVRGEPLDHLDRAVRNYTHHDVFASADELRKVVFFLQVFAERTEDPIFVDLENCASDLDLLANDVESDVLENSTLFNQRVGETQLTLARYHLTQARSRAAAGNLTNANRDLGAAADDLEAYLASTDQSLDRNARALLTQINRSADRLAQASAQQTTTMTRSLARLLEHYARAAR